MNYQFTSRQLTLVNLSRSNQGQMTFKRLHLLNGASSYQILHETHIWVALGGGILIFFRKTILSHFTFCAIFNITKNNTTIHAYGRSLLP